MKARVVNLPGAFQRYRAEIDAEMRAVFEGRDSPLYDMLRYHLGWVDREGNPAAGDGGKALRPTLCLLACEAVGGEYRQALPAAAALELLHNFTLVHDDIQDNDRERRHRPTLWSLWGKEQALNAGDTMHALVNSALYRLREEGIPADKQVEAMNLLNEGCLSVIEGQYLDLSYESRLDITVEDYLKMIALKTAALISCAAEMGALLGTGSRATRSGMRRFGHWLGLAFQVRDDILGIWGEESATGKPVASDIRRKKKSLPIVCALDSGDQELVRVYKKPSLDEDDVRFILARLDIEKVQARADEFHRQAMTELQDMSLKPRIREELVELARFLAERNY